MLSRLPLPDFPNQIPTPGKIILLLDILYSLPVTAEHIKKLNQDPTLSRVRTLIQQGWQFTNDADFKPYMRRSEELSVYDGCVLWGSRVIVPPQGHTKIIKELHEGHPGSTRMKALARSLCGGLNLTEIWRMWYKTVKFSKHIATYHCSLGNGPKGHGLECILIMLDHC